MIDLGAAGRPAGWLLTVHTRRPAPESAGRGRPTLTCGRTGGRCWGWGARCRGKLATAGADHD